MSDINFSGWRKEEPIEAVVPAVQGIPITSVGAAQIADVKAVFDLGADYSNKDTLRVNASLYVSTARHSNMSVSGLTLPEAGVHQDSAALEFRSTFTKVGKDYIHRGGISSDWSNSDLSANYGGHSVSVSGAFIGGGADVDKQNTQWVRWTLKNVLQFNTDNHNWSVGALISRRGDEENAIPNPFGHINFDNLSDYILSATIGADAGSGMVTKGKDSVQYASCTAAPFVEAEMLRRTRVVVRGGFRADAQTAGGILFSPRLSAVSILHGFALRGGTGMFVQNWANDVVLKLLENDGNHLQQFLITNASLSNLEAATATLRSEIATKIAPDQTPTRNWVSKLSFEHPFGGFLPGVESTWMDGTRLLGSHRVTAPTGWTDVLESNRAQRKHQFHFRAQYRIRGQSLTAHYEWMHARDDTDGPFSFPARQDDISGEWGPTRGTAAGNVSWVRNLRFGKAFSLALVGSWHSPLPLNMTSGLDPTGNGLYTDRAGRTRNSGRGSYFNSAQLFAPRRCAVPKLFTESMQKVYADLGVQVINLLGEKDYIYMGTVIGSPLFMQPLAAAPGRPIQFSLSFSRLFQMVRPRIPLLLAQGRTSANHPIADRRRPDGVWSRICKWGSTVPF
jgi:hypothetical protein